jgi:hypothetical protein
LTSSSIWVIGIADTSKKILVSRATGPKADSASQKTLLTKGRKINRAGNAQRKHKFIRTARSPFSLRPFLCAHVSAMQERYYRENTEESEKHSTQTACFFTLFSISAVFEVQAQVPSTLYVVCVYVNP